MHEIRMIESWPEALQSLAKPPAEQVAVHAPEERAGGVRRVLHPAPGGAAHEPAHPGTRGPEGSRERSWSQRKSVQLHVVLSFGASLFIIDSWPALLGVSRVETTSTRLRAVLFPVNAAVRPVTFEGFL